MRHLAAIVVPLHLSLPFGATAQSDSARTARPASVVISGTVRDTFDAPIASAVITIPGMNVGTMTNAEGRYLLRVPRASLPPAPSILVRRIGYNQIRRPLTNSDSVSVTLDFTMQLTVVQLVGVPILGVGEAELYRGRVARYDAFRSTRSATRATIGGPFDRESYHATRAFVADSELPPPGLVRPEGWINYFPHRWPAALTRDSVALAVDLVEVPWIASHRMVRATLLTKPPRASGPPRNVVYVLDASGTMWAENGLPLAKRALDRLATLLQPEDRMSILVFGGPRGEILAGAPGDQAARIRRAVAAVEQGPPGAPVERLLERAIDVARASAVGGAETHVVLVTDDDGAAAELGLSSDSAAAVLRAARDLRFDVVRVGDGGASPRLADLARASGGVVSLGEDNVHLTRALARPFGIELAPVASGARFELRFDRGAVRQWRCLNDVGQRHEGGAPAREIDYLFAGDALTVLCEIEPAPGRTVDDAVAVTVLYTDAGGTTRRLAARAAPDAALRQETRFLTAVAGAALRLRNASGMSGWSLSTFADYVRGLGLDLPGDHVADFVSLLEQASRAK